MKYIFICILEFCKVNSTQILKKTFITEIHWNIKVSLTNKIL